MNKARNPLELAPRMFESYVLLFHVVTRIIDRRFAKELRPYHVTNRQAWIMLATEQGPYNQATVARILDVSTNQMVVEVEKLERRGLIKRIRNPEKRREMLLELTVKGKQLAAKYRSHMHASRARIFSPARIQDIDHNTEVAKDIINDYYRRHADSDLR